MKGIIDQFIRKLKHFERGNFADDLFVFLVIILVGLGSFALGRISLQAGASDQTLKIDDTGVEQGIWEEYAKNQSRNKSYVASKNGTKYYPINCSATNRIKEENRIYFVDKDGAEGAGYSATTACGDF